MKKITFIIFALCCGLCMYAQKPEITSIGIAGRAVKGFDDFNKTEMFTKVADGEFVWIGYLYYNQTSPSSSTGSRGFKCKVNSTSQGNDWTASGFWSLRAVSKDNEEVSSGNTYSVNYSQQSGNTDYKWRLKQGEDGYYKITFFTKDVNSVTMRLDKVSESFADLHRLSVDGADLIPAFDPAITDYTCVLMKGTVSATTSVITYPDLPASGVGTVDVSGGSGQSVIKVTSVDGAVTKTYTITYRYADDGPVNYTHLISNNDFDYVAPGVAFGDTANFSNPVMAGSYADPTVIRIGNMFYLYVTSDRVRGYKSTNLINWDRINGSYSEVFTTKPNFTVDTEGTGMWAPDINYFDGHYVMYYSISKWSGGATCGIGVGVSDKPGGPFLPPAGNSTGKLFLSSEIGVNNSIDPCFFEENDKRYLFWGSFSGIYMTELASDGMTVKDLTKKTKVGGNSFEGTYIHKRGDYYYLFASIGGCCDGFESTYKVVVGRSTKLEGPYLSKSGAKMTDVNNWNPTSYNPIILKGNTMFGAPGHNSRIITDDNGVDWILYHAYVSEEINDDTNRQLLLDKVEWDSNGCLL